MRVALLGPIAWRTPPRAYGPWEQVVSLLADGLVDLGVDVTLFATLDSVTRATLDGVCERPYGEDPTVDGRIWEALHVAHCFGRSADFDLVHNHLDWLPLALDGFCAAPLVTTVHGFSSDRILPAYQRSRSAFVSISHADRAPGVPYVATVPHGIDVDSFPYTAVPGDTLVAFGRIHPDKGTSDAIEIARRVGRPLLICGPVQDERYFAEHVEPFVDDHAVRYLGNVGPAERARVLGTSACLLHPIAFAEPFGLSVVEAMACGTPVVAFRRGSMPEVVDEGQTGFLADDVSSAVGAVRRAVALDRTVVRDVATKRFAARRMVEQYVRIYEEVMSGVGRG